MCQRKLKLIQYVQEKYQCYIGFIVYKYAQHVLNFMVLFKRLIWPSWLGLQNILTAPYGYPGYDTKSDGEAPAMLEFWGMQNTPLLLSLPGPLWEEWKHLIVLSMGQIKLCVNKKKTVLILNWIVWNRTDYMYKNGFGIK